MIDVTEVTEPKAHHKKSCKCQTRCKQFFRVNGIDVYCKGSMEQLAITILNVCNGTQIANGNINQRGWTTGQEQQLIDFIKRNGVKYGTYRMLGAMFNKKRSSVKYKVYALVDAGKIEKEWLMNYEDSSV